MEVNETLYVGACGDEDCGKEYKIIATDIWPDYGGGARIKLSMQHRKVVVALSFNIREVGRHDLMNAATLTRRLARDLELVGKDCAPTWRKAYESLASKT